MKIGGDIQTSELARINQGRSTSSATGGAAFADILAQAVGEAPAGLGASACAANTSACASSEGVGADLTLCQQTNGLLDALDTYGQALADGGKTLKEIEPLAAELESRAQELGASLEAGDQDALGGIAMQAVTQARVEAFKFRRGDYV